MEGPEYDQYKNLAHAMIDEASFCFNGQRVSTIRCCDGCGRQIRYGQDPLDDVFLLPGETPPSRPSRLLCWRCENTDPPHPYMFFEHV